jgi:hypothetical protein
MPPNALADLDGPSSMPGQIGQIIIKTVAFTRHLAEKRQTAPAKGMPDAGAVSAREFPDWFDTATVMLEDVGFDRADRARCTARARGYAGRAALGRQPRARKRTTGR